MCVTLSVEQQAKHVLNVTKSDSYPYTYVRALFLSNYIKYGETRFLSVIHKATH